MRRRKRKMNVKLIIALLSFVLLFGGTIGGSLAWLLDQSAEVQNVFTTSDINIDLIETDTDNNNKKEFQMIPGWKIDKDPIVKVDKDSEDCFVFVEITTAAGYSIIENKDQTSGKILYYSLKKGNDTYIDFNIANGWSPVTGEDNVFYREVTITDADTDQTLMYSILGKGDYTIGTDKYSWNDNQVLTNPNITKTMMEALKVEGATLPSLKFTAYAVQLKKDNDTKFDPATAWVNAETLKTTVTP